MRQLILFLILIISLSQWYSLSGQQRICLDFGAKLGTTRLNFEGMELENLKPVFNQNALFAGIQYKIGKYLELGFQICDQKSIWKFSDNQVISLTNGEYIKFESQSTIQVQTFSGSVGFLKPFKGFPPILCVGESGVMNSGFCISSS